jgi:hypothetical protein
LAASTTLIKLFVEILEFSKNEIKFREIFFVKENKESLRMVKGIQNLNIESSSYSKRNSMKQLCT